MRAKTFAMVKETIATGGMADAVGSAQIPANYSSDCVEPSNVVQMKRERDVSASDAHRIVARVSLGKHSVLFRLGNDAAERAHAIDELSRILKKSDGPKKVPFNMQICRCIAGAALDELAFDTCAECTGRGVVRDHDNETLEGKQPMKTCPACGGARRWRHNEDGHISSLAKAWRIQVGVRCETQIEERRADAEIATQLRANKSMHRMVECLEYAKSILLESERIAVEETATMVERW
jgi:hypothetical protein